MHVIVMWHFIFADMLDMHATSVTTADNYDISV